MLLLYIRQRFPAAVFVPLAVFLVMAGLGASGVRFPGWPRVGVALLLACGLVFQFRLWDDLHDRQRDGRDHPDRVLPQASSVAPFYALLAATCVLNLVLLACSTVAVMGYAALNAGFFLRYRLRDGVNHHLTLLKYPAFVYFLAATLVTRVSWLVLTLVYFTFCCYEVLHDGRVHRAWLVVDGLAWCLLVCLLPFSAKHFALSITIAAASTVAFAIIVYHYQRGALPQWATRGMFLLTFLQLPALTIGCV